MKPTNPESVAIDPFLAKINVIGANPTLRLTDANTLKKVPSESTVIEARARLTNQPHCVVVWQTMVVLTTKVCCN